MWLDSDGDGDVDRHDFIEDDVIGVLVFVIKMMSIALCALAWCSIRASRKLSKKRSHVSSRELLIFACSPASAQLPEAVVEATEVSRLIDASIHARGDVTANELRSALLAVPTRRFLFIGHADASLDQREEEEEEQNDPQLAAMMVARYGVARRRRRRVVFGSRTLGFVTQSGHLSAVVASDLAGLLGRHGADRGGPLELVFLNGCNSESLAVAVCDAGVPFVVCWRTKAHDAAARIFSMAFFEALAHLKTTQQHACPDANKVRRRLRKKDTSLHCYVKAFREALDSLRFETRPGTLANGVQASVPKFEIADPSTSDSEERTRRTCKPAPIAAGIPWFVTSKSFPENLLDPKEFDRSIAPLFDKLVKNCVRSKLSLARRRNEEEDDDYGAYSSDERRGEGEKDESGSRNKNFVKSLTGTSLAPSKLTRFRSDGDGLPR